MTAPLKPMGETLPLVIAIDGPAGSGKSSVAKQVARELGIDINADYLDLSLHTRLAQPGLDFGQVPACTPTGTPLVWPTSGTTTDQPFEGAKS